MAYMIHQNRCINVFFFKLSGEQLAGKYDSGVDTELMAWLADQIKPVVGLEQR